MKYLESEEWLRRWSRVCEAQSYCPYHHDEHVPPNRHCLFVDALRDTISDHYHALIIHMALFLSVLHGRRDSGVFVV